MTTSPVRVTRQPTWRSVFFVLTTVAGLWLFARSVQTIGVDSIRDSLQRLGWGFVVILVLSGAREVVRTLAWMRAVEGPARPRFAPAFRARLAGEALSTLLPMGMVVGEPAKAAGVGPSVPFARAFAGLAVEFVFYAASLVPVVVAGTLAFMVVTRVRIVTWALVVAALLATSAVAVVILRSQRNALGRRPARAGASSGRAKSQLEAAVARVRRAVDLVFGFRTRCPEHLLPIATHEASYQVLAVAEVYVTLWLINPRPPTVASAIVLETVGRLVTIAFQALPMRVGVDEAGAAIMASRLDLGTASGVALALVRKLRLLFWSAVGLALLIRKPALETRAPLVPLAPRTGVTCEQPSL